MKSSALAFILFTFVQFVPCSGTFLLADQNPSPSNGDALKLPPIGHLFSLVLKSSDLVFYIGNKDNGRELEMNAFHGWLEQYFYLQPAGSPGIFRIVSKISGFSLGEEKDGKVTASRGRGNLAQRWRFAAADGGIRVINAASGRAITCEDNRRGMLRDIDPALPQIFTFRRMVTPTCHLPRRRPEYANIPIIDVHTHIMGLDKNADFIAIGDILEKKYDTRIDIWIDLDGNFGTGYKETYPAESRKRYGERIQYVLQTGYQDLLIFKPDDITLWTKRGDVVGYKMWWGYQKGIDDPANDPTYARMAEVGLPVASAHVTHPFFSKEFPEERWTETMDRWERVLARHPKLVAVMAHMGSMLIDGIRMERLERMLKKYPNLHIDTCYGFTEFSLSDYERIRSFIIKYADRILFGTDLSSRIPITKAKYEALAAQYDSTFRIFETDEYVYAPAFLMGDGYYRGLNLPRDVLEKIYYRNALRIYPGLRKALNAVRGGGF